MAALAAILAKSMAKGMATSAASQLKSEARDMAQDLKSEAKGLAYDYRNQAKAAATNYLDTKKNRIYQTASNAFYTKTGGRRNYNPMPAYRNVVGTSAVTPLY